MNQPWVYMCSPSCTPPPPSPSHPSGSSQCTSPKHPVSCIEPGLVICFTYDNIHVSMPFSTLAFSHRVQKTVLYIYASFVVSHRVIITIFLNSIYIAWVLRKLQVDHCQWLPDVIQSLGSFCFSALPSKAASYSCHVTAATVADTTSAWKKSIETMGPSPVPRSPHADYLSHLTGQNCVTVHRLNQSLGRKTGSARLA